MYRFQYLLPLVVLGWSQIACAQNFYYWDYFSHYPAATPAASCAALQSGCEYGNAGRGCSIVSMSVTSETTATCTIRQENGDWPLINEYPLQRRGNSCPPGTEYDSSTGECEIENFESCSSTTATTTQFPIDCATGQKRLTETDYRSFGPDPLVYTREYVSPIYRNNTLYYRLLDWSPSNTPSLSIIDGGQYMRLAVFRIGNRVQRSLVSHSYGPWQATHSNLLAISMLSDSVVIYAGTTYHFDASSLEVSTEGLLEQRYQFDADQRLTQIENRFGKTLVLSYANGHLASLVDQDGLSINYHYDEHDNLAEVVYPDATPGDPADNPRRRYLYENPTYPKNLTGVIDENGVRIATYSYDETGLAIGSVHSDGANQEEVIYPAANEAIVRYYRDATAFREEHLKYQKMNGQFRLTERTTTCPNCPASTETWVYDLYNGNRLSSHTDANGNRTEYLYNAEDNRRPAGRIEAAGTPQARAIDYRWHPNFDVKTFLGETGRQTDLTYDGQGLLKERRVSAAP